jgi:hypothetical protein
MTNGARLVRDAAAVADADEMAGLLGELARRETMLLLKVPKGSRK